MRCPECGHEFLMSESDEGFGGKTPFEKEGEEGMGYSPKDLWAFESGESLEFGRKTREDV